jgi:AcrR family transcriptional regulator
MPSVESLAAYAPGLPRQRAVDALEKAARKSAILDAVERLYAHAQVLPSVAEVASEAGLAKGTMYLYFESKEAMYLGVHVRHCQRFFERLISQLEADAPFGCEDMVTLVDDHMIAAPSYLPLSNACMSTPSERMNDATWGSFHSRLSGWLFRAGAGLEQRLHKLKPGDGVRFLQHGYALVLGLYQLVGQNAVCKLHARVPIAALASNFQGEVHAGLRGLWSQAQNHGLPQAT